MPEITVDRTVVEPRHNLITLTHVMYGMHAFSALMGLLTQPMGIAFLPVHLDWAPLSVDLPCVADYAP